jgi:hypothetical protein
MLWNMMTMKRTRKSGITLLLFTAVLLLPATTRGEEWNTILDLRGQWKFQTGDNPLWSEPGIDDRKWESIFVPSAWEDEGFPGYDGYAWYRKSFTLPAEADDRSAYLHLGYVDDVCEVYVNGHMVGFSGSFPPNYQTAYDSYQQFRLPAGILRKGAANVVAVRVYDAQLSGGILRGKIGLYELRNDLKPEISLPGVWKFRTGDNMAWASPSADDHEWQDALVPAFWETMGLRDYDGFGWYRVAFRVPKGSREKQLVLLLGRIDDIDEAYLNGQRIGKTGSMSSQKGLPDFNEEYREVRAYTIPKGLLGDQDNVLAVRVYDGFQHGGIYDGPVGIVTRDQYRKWKNAQEGGWNFLDFFR